MSFALKAYFRVPWQRAAPNDHKDSRFRSVSIPPEQGALVRAIIFWPMEVLESGAIDVEKPTQSQILDW